MKQFKIELHPPTVKEIICNPPILFWIKVNTDGAATKNPLNGGLTLNIGLSLPTNTFEGRTNFI